MFYHNIYIISSYFIFIEPFWLKQIQKRSNRKKKHTICKKKTWWSICFRYGIYDHWLTNSRKKSKAKKFCCVSQKNLSFTSYKQNKCLLCHRLGPAYLFTSDLSQLLYEKSLSTKTIRLEDAYVGLLATKLDSNFLELKMDGKYLIKHRVEDMYREHLISEICSYQEYEGLCGSLQEGYD